MEHRYGETVALFTICIQSALDAAPRRLLPKTTKQTRAGDSVFGLSGSTNRSGLIRSRLQ